MRIILGKKVRLKPTEEQEHQLWKSAGTSRWAYNWALDRLEMRNFADVDKLVRAKVARRDINMLVKLVEGLGHLGVVTTVDKLEGEVLIQTTKDCWPDLEVALQHMPIQIELI